MKVLKVYRYSPSPAPAPFLSERRKSEKAEAHLDLSQQGVKKFDTIKDGDGNILDFRDMQIRGYLSTFGNIDRQGDIVKKGAFTQGIEAFMRNPVLLIDHSRDVHSIAGFFYKVVEDSKGLYVEAHITNSPAMAHVRALLAEGALKTMSMGGMFAYDQSGKFIEKVELYEGSLVSVPANPEAIIAVR